MMLFQPETRRDEVLSILLIDGDPEEAQRLKYLLTATTAMRPGDPNITLEYADRVSTGLARLLTGGIDLVLLELSLPDGSGVETLLRVRRHAPDVPVVVLTALDDEAVGLRAIQAGAQDYIIKGRLTRDLLMRAIQYARERHRRQRDLQDLAFADPLTGLHNRRGFLACAEQPVAMAKRNNQRVGLFLVDLDGMKYINDTFGHLAGDRALVEAASVLRRTFRNSDILARLGGDEFAVLSVNASPDVVDRLIARLRSRVDEHNRSSAQEFKLSLSVGVAVLGDVVAATLEELLHRADEALYAEKREKRAAAVTPSGAIYGAAAIADAGVEWGTPAAANPAG